uniref:Uncharacterized protein n=1 Tax=Babesia bovis TaxID=5865 RepID=S6B2A5_BABBO|nr:hypothetical protein BEWA_018510 [Babesia bovis]
MCQYMYFSTVTDRCLPSDDVYSKLSIRCVRKHALKNIEQFMDDLSLAVKYVVVCLNSTAPMDPKEVNMLRDVLGKHDQLGKEDILILYEALANAQNELPEDTMAKTRELVRQAWDMLPTLSIRDCSHLMNHGKLDICAMVGAQAVEELFQRLTSDIKQLESDVVLRLVEFASKQNHLSTRMIGIIEVDPSIIPVTATAAVAVLELYLNAGRSCDSKACKWARDKLTNRRTIIDPRYSERMQRIVDRISTHNAS